MKKVYVTGQLKGTSKDKTRHNRHALSLVCRNILLTDNIPVCPILSSEDWYLDPRLPSSDDWWVNNYLIEFIKDCQEFCYIPLPPGVYNNRVDKEMRFWRAIGSGVFIPSHNVVKILLGADND